MSSFFSLQLERLRDAHRRTEGALRKEITQAKKAEEEARRLNEEFKKKVRRGSVQGQKEKGRVVEGSV
ncbi:hypothetical protein E2C01_102694 [Portunus trituberculatus]|uniref:Uncharacterized protein n=1 Tax=Portunus trituberculatus TaxID=210409 RepID=A0A5B7KDY1_PORTR|nr:hypothetical protein [Portunus trituberculatus]